MVGAGDGQHTFLDGLGVDPPWILILTPAILMELFYVSVINSLPALKECKMWSPPMQFAHTPLKVNGYSLQKLEVQQHCHHEYTKFSVGTLLVHYQHGLTFGEVSLIESVCG